MTLFFVLAGERMRTTEEVFSEFARVLRFPDYFGGNWGASDECMADLEWLGIFDRAVLLVEGAGELLAGEDEHQREPTGTFVSPEGTPFPERALPGWYQTGKSLKTYEVTKPICDVKMGTIEPWFGQPGMGVQYDLPRPIDELVAEGYLKEV